MDKENVHKKKTKLQQFEPKGEAFSLLKLKNASMEVKFEERESLKGMVQPSGGPRD